MTPDRVLDILREGNRIFRTGHHLSDDLGRQMLATTAEQNPLAMVLNCIDSRVPVLLVLELGLGDIFSGRVAGNVITTESLSSMEYGVDISGVKLVLVRGHTHCGAVTSSVKLICGTKDPAEATGCQHRPSRRAKSTIWKKPIWNP